MKSTKLLARIITDSQIPVLVQELEAHLGLVSEIVPISGGLVHHVFQVHGESGSAYLKIRGETFSQIPSITINPAFIDNEKRAIEYFNKKTADYFPSVIAYNAAWHYLLLSDVMPQGVTLEKQYSQNAVTIDQIRNLGCAIGHIHVRHADTMDAVTLSKAGDAQLQADILKYVLEFYKHPRLLAAAKEHRRRPTQLLIGDLSPKNIYVAGKTVRFCDLEDAHQGALVYDQAYALAHILLHQNSERAAVNALRAFFEGYREHGLATDYNDELLAVTLQGILLYRLDNTVIPYSLPYTLARRHQMAANVLTSLDKHTNNLERIVVNVFKG